MTPELQDEVIALLSRIDRKVTYMHDDLVDLNQRLDLVGASMALLHQGIVVRSARMDRVVNRLDRVTDHVDRLVRLP